MNDQSATDTHRSSALIDVWYLMAGRIAPQICCRYPPPMYRAFQAAVSEVSKESGDLDTAVLLLREIILTIPPENMLFQQAGQLLNIIEWRRNKHPVWFSSHDHGNRMKPGKCAPYVARAMALLETGADDDALDLAARIITRAEPESDDVRIARMIRAAILICQGYSDEGEEEFLLITGTSVADEKNNTYINH